MILLPQSWQLASPTHFTREGELTCGSGEWRWRGEGEREGLRGLKIEELLLTNIGRTGVDQNWKGIFCSTVES